MSGSIIFPLFELVNCISDAVDLVNHRIIEHHKRVAYIAYAIASELGFTGEEKTNVLLAGLLHDIGATACSNQENTEILNFDVVNPHNHALAGYLLLLKFKQFGDLGEIVRGHHVPWKEGKGSEFKGEPVPLSSHVIHLADRIDILMKDNSNILDQVTIIRNRIQKNKGKTFHPEIVSAFEKISHQESFWLDLTSPGIKERLNELQDFPIIEISYEELLNMANLISHIIDFRSSFTATHSSGVAACAAILGKLLKMDEYKIILLRIAGFLHDIGKLAVPKEVLEKPDVLTEEEFNIVKKHAYYTRRILNNVSFFSQVSHWASAHHEHLDGDGYPFHLADTKLDQGARIIAVSDVFVALLEDRPYRKGLKKETVIEILQKCVAGNVLDNQVVATLLNNFDEINTARINSQEEAKTAYGDFWRQANQLS